MISICIPIYNCDVTALVNDLYKQCTDSQIRYEILLLDDASVNTDTKEKNRNLTNLTNIHYYDNPENIGLARTRNRLGELARYPYLLFIDSDAEVVSREYLIRYLKLCQPSVVCFGGCVYPDKCLDSRYVLRWKYGKKREEGIGKYYSCFNFLIDRKVFLKYPFSQLLHQYGYEDTLFGMVLKKNNIDVFFVDNPLLHAGLTTSENYIVKVEQSLSNLLMIETFMKEEGVSHEIRLLRKAGQVEQLHLQPLVIFLWRILKGICLSNLKGKKPSLFLLDFYKLGYFCNLKRQKRYVDS